MTDAATAPEKVLGDTPKMVVFLGPSLSHDEARELAPEAILLPPVCQGDLLSACEMYAPEVVVIIDGEFGQSLSVWHKEVLFVIDQGVRVFGASSMGALRASELDRFGMEGIGEVYRHYAEGFLTADEDVALLHADAEYGWRPFTWPMVNVWATVAHLRESGIVADDGCDAIQAAANAIHFTQRSRNALAQKMAEQGRSDSEELADAFVQNFVDQKKLDAIEGIRTGLNSRNVPKPPHDEPLHLFGRIGESMQSTDTLVPSASHPMRRYQLVNDVALHDPDFERFSQRALDRAVVLEYAYEAGVEPTPEEIEVEARRFFATIGLTEEQIPEWVEANDFMPGELDRFLRDEARRRHMQRWALDVRLYERNRRIIIDELRFENKYIDAVKAASRRRQLVESRPQIEWPTDSETLVDLIVRHSISAKWKLFVDLETTANDHGFENTSGLLTAILDATAARQEASARRERMAKLFGESAAAATPVVEVVDEAERNAARVAHGALEAHQLTAISLAFVDLGVADALAAGAATVEAIATACGAAPDRMGRFLAASRNAGFVANDGDTWSLTLVGEVFRSDHHASMAPYARDMRDRSIPMWAQLAEVVRGAEASANPPFADGDASFSSATWAIGADALIAGLFSADYDGHIVDVGGGLGRAAMFVAAHCTNAKVSLVDQPEVAERARTTTAGTRVEVHAADTFAGNSDRVTMSRVICTLTDDAATQLLASVRSWLNEGAEVHVIDSIPSDLMATSTVDLFNLVRGGGGARTEAQWNELAAATGFTVSEIRPFMGPFSDIVLIPN